MVMHVVLMRLRPGISRAALDELARYLGDLAESVAGPNACVVGPNITEEPLSHGFEFGFALRFASHAELDAYHVNPAHLPISLAIRDVSRTVLVFDLALAA
jgi:Stress responsive A/B Barrel Domain